DHRPNVLGKAGTAVARSWENKMGADAAIQADRATHFADIGVKPPTQSGDFVDEGNLGRKHGVGGVLAHLSAAAVHHKYGIAGAHERLLEPPVRLQAPRGLGPPEDT